MRWILEIDPKDKCYNKHNKWGKLNHYWKSALIAVHQDQSMNESKYKKCWDKL